MEAGSGNGRIGAPFTDRSPTAPGTNGSDVVNLTSQPFAMPNVKSSRSQSFSSSPSLKLPTKLNKEPNSSSGFEGAVKVQVSTPFAEPVVSFQPIEVSCETQESPPFVCESSAAKVILGVLTVVVQSTLKTPLASAKNCMLPQGGLPGPPPFTFTRPSRPSARTTLDAKIMTPATTISLKAFKCAPPCNFRHLLGSICSTKPCVYGLPRKPCVFNVHFWPPDGFQNAMCNVFDQLGNTRYFGVIPCSPYHESPSVPCPCRVVNTRVDS